MLLIGCDLTPPDALLTTGFAKLRISATEGALDVSFDRLTTSTLIDYIKSRLYREVQIWFNDPVITLYYIGFAIVHDCTPFVSVVHSPTVFSSQSIMGAISLAETRLIRRAQTAILDRIKRG